MGQPYGETLERGFHCSVFLDTVGDQSGSIDASVNGSLTPVEFKVTAPADEIMLIHRLLVYIQDGGNFGATTYGAISTLSNGLTIELRDADDNVREDLTVQHTIKSNGDWATYCYDSIPGGYGVGDESIQIRWTFTKDGAPLYLPPDHSFVCIVNDNLVGLNQHHFRVGLTRTPVNL